MEKYNNYTDYPDYDDEQDNKFLDGVEVIVLVFIFSMGWLWDKWDSSFVKSCVFLGLGVISLLAFALFPQDNWADVFTSVFVALCFYLTIRFGLAYSK